MSNEIETLYESPETTPDGNPFMTVKKARGYYYYAERGGVDSVFFILYDSNINKFALISEGKPPRDETMGLRASMVTAFGGSIDSDKSRKALVKLEVLEEAGYKVRKRNIQFVGSTLVSSQMSQMAYGYLVDVTNLTNTEDIEPNTAVIWMNSTELLNNLDWKAIFILSLYSSPAKGP